MGKEVKCPNTSDQDCSHVFLRSVYCNRQFLPVLRKQFKGQAKFHAKTFTIYSHFILKRLNLQPRQTVISSEIIINNIVLETIKKN